MFLAVHISYVIKMLATLNPFTFDQLRTCYVCHLTGGQGGSGSRSNGLGGWSYYNSEAVLAVLDPDGRQRYALRHLRGGTGQY